MTSLSLLLAGAALCGAAELPDAPVPEPQGYSARVDAELAGGAVLGFEALGDEEGTLRRFLLTLKPAAGPVPSSAIVIVMPLDGGPIRSRQVLLAPPEAAGAVLRWEVLDQLRAAAELGKFPLRLAEQTQIMVQFLTGTRKGESLGVPVSAPWQK